MERQNIDELARKLSAGLTLDQMREKQNALVAGRRYIHDEGDEARAFSRLPNCSEGLSLSGMASLISW